MKMKNLYMKIVENEKSNPPTKYPKQSMVWPIRSFNQIVDLLIKSILDIYMRVKEIRLI